MAPPVGWSGKATLASCRCFFPVHLLCAFCVLICSCCSTVFSSRTPETSHARYRWVQQDSVFIHHLWSLKAEAGQHVGTQGTCQETCDSITDLCCLLLTLWPVMAGDFEDWLQHTDDRSSWDPASENGEERDPPKRDVERELRDQTTKELRVPQRLTEELWWHCAQCWCCDSAACVEGPRLQGGSDTSEWCWSRNGTTNSLSRGLKSGHCWPFLDHAEGRAEVFFVASGDSNYFK